MTENIPTAPVSPLFARLKSYQYLNKSVEKEINLDSYTLFETQQVRMKIESDVLELKNRVSLIEQEE